MLVRLGIKDSEEHAGVLLFKSYSIVKQRLKADSKCIEKGQCARSENR